MTVYVCYIISHTRKSACNINHIPKEDLVSRATVTKWISLAAQKILLWIQPLNLSVVQCVQRILISKWCKTHGKKNPASWKDHKMFLSLISVRWFQYFLKVLKKALQIYRFMTEIFPSVRGWTLHTHGRKRLKVLHFKLVEHIKKKPAVPRILGNPLQEKALTEILIHVVNKINMLRDQNIFWNLPISKGKIFTHIAFSYQFLNRTGVLEIMQKFIGSEGKSACWGVWIAWISCGLDFTFCLRVILTWAKLWIFPFTQHNHQYLQGS